MTKEEIGKKLLQLLLGLGMSQEQMNTGESLEVIYLDLTEDQDIDSNDVLIKHICGGFPAVPYDWVCDAIVSASSFDDLVDYLQAYLKRNRYFDRYVG